MAAPASEAVREELRKILKKPKVQENVKKARKTLENLQQSFAALMQRRQEQESGRHP